MQSGPHAQTVGEMRRVGDVGGGSCGVLGEVLQADDSSHVRCGADVGDTVAEEKPSLDQQMEGSEVVGSEEGTSESATPSDPSLTEGSPTGFDVEGDPTGLQNYRSLHVANAQPTCRRANDDSKTPRAGAGTTDVGSQERHLLAAQRKEVVGSACPMAGEIRSHGGELGVPIVRGSSSGAEVGESCVDGAFIETRQHLFPGQLFHATGDCATVGTRKSAGTRGVDEVHRSSPSATGPGLVSTDVSPIVGRSDEPKNSGGWHGTRPATETGGTEFQDSLRTASSGIGTATCGVDKTERPGQPSLSAASGHGLVELGDNSEQGTAAEAIADRRTTATRCHTNSLAEDTRSGFPGFGDGGPNSSGDGDDSTQWKEGATLKPIWDIARSRGSQSVVEVDWTLAASSSAASSLVVWVGENRFAMRSGGRCTDPLAEIEGGRMNVRRLRQWALELGEWSPELEDMWSWISTSALSEKLQLHLDTAEGYQKEARRPVSRGFSNEDACMLSRAGVLSVAEPLLVASAFKVKKRSGGSRFVWNGKRFNALFHDAGFQVPAMHLPSLTEMVELALRFPFAAGRDATAYFYQFEVADALSRFFGVFMGSRRGDFQRMVMRVTPMGVCFVPAFAQRCANCVLRLLKRRCPDIIFEARCWVDNFFFFTRTRQDLVVVLEKFAQLAEELQLKLKPTEFSDHSGRFEFLGLLAEMGVRVSPSKEIRDGLRADWTANSVREAMQRVGLGLFVNFAVARKPLCDYPEMMRILRGLCAAGSGSGWDTPHMLTPQEVKLLREFLEAMSASSVEPSVEEAQNDVVVWSDASGSHVAGVLQQRELTPDWFVYEHDIDNINVAEFVAFALAVETWRPAAGSCFAIDNRGVVDAVIRGHSTNGICDALLRKILPRIEHCKFAWVPSAKQRADGLTRGGGPGPCWHPRGWGPKWRT